MKYLLKKDLPTIKAGTEFEYKHNILTGSYGVELVKGDTIGGILDFINGFGIDNDFFEPIKESKAWKPDRGDKYWFIYEQGSIDDEAWDHGLVDNGRLAYGNIYKTQEEAIKARDKQLAIVRLRNYLIENDMLLSYEEANATGFMSYIAIDRFTKNITSVISESFIGYSPFGNINSYYAEQFIKDCESDLRLIFLP